LTSLVSGFRIDQVSPEVRRRARRVVELRKDASGEEWCLRQAIRAALEDHGAAKKAATQMRVSEQYLSDVRAGRRRISDEMLERILA
jgi:hypothetical protein